MPGLRKTIEGKETNPDDPRGGFDMRMNDEVAQERIDALETDNLALRVQNQLLEEEVLSLKVWMQQKFANADWQVV